jgi:hypothetical protein
MSLPQSGVKFEAETCDSCMPYLWVWAVGRIDYCTFVTPVVATDGRLVLPVLDVVVPILTLARAAASNGYRDVFPRRWLERPRRFDWFIAVSTHIRQADRQQLPWSDLIFPGVCPPRAGGDQRPFRPPDGYARRALAGWKPGRSLGQLVRAFLDSFLNRTATTTARVRSTISDAPRITRIVGDGLLGGCRSPRVSRASNTSVARSSCQSKYRPPTSLKHGG